MTGRILVTTQSGKERSFSYERLTAAQETKLRSLAQPLPTRQTVKASRKSGKPKKSINYAESILWTRNGLTEVL